MCTVSLVPREDGFRLLCNRDEQVSRPPALPPRWQTAGATVVACPLDPQGRGTWVAVSQDGLAVALLNRERTGAGAVRPPRIGVRSRGEIPLALVGAAGMAGVRQVLARLDPAAYEAFHVVVAWFDRLLIGASDGVGLWIAEQTLTGPIAFTSSAVGDRDAERFRLPLFRSLVVESADPWTGQRTFHDHRWTDRPEFSVRMRRPGARTLSRTRIDVKGSRVALDYEPLSDAP